MGGKTRPREKYSGKRMDERKWEAGGWKKNDGGTRTKLRGWRKEECGKILKFEIVYQVGGRRRRLGEYSLRRKGEREKRREQERTGKEEK